MDPRGLAEWYSTSETSAIAGVSLRQLQWWDETDALVPVHHGKQRRYSPVDVVSAMVARELRRRQISSKKIRGALRKAQAAIRLALAEGQEAVMVIPYDSQGKGYTVHHVEVMNPDQLIAWMKVHGGCAAIAILDLVHELAEATTPRAGRRRPGPRPELSLPRQALLWPGEGPGNPHR